MNPLFFSPEIKARWFHRLYIVIMRPFFVISILAVILCAFNFNQSFKMYNKYVDEYAAEGCKANSLPHIMSDLYQKDIDSAWWYGCFFLITWPSLFILYRVVLFVVMGGKAFRNSIPLPQKILDP